MPMYEKGSVRAGPRSKQQERMKKIMKKFLSSLLALTMILSLVIIPANAHDGLTVEKGNATITAKVGTSNVPEKGVASGTQVTFTVTGTPTVTGTEEGATVTYTYKWDNGEVTSSNSYTKAISGNSGENVSTTCTVIATSGDKNGEVPLDAKMVKVITDQDAFEGSLTTVTYKGNSFEITKAEAGWTAAVKYIGTKPTSGIEANTGVSSYDSTTEKLTVAKTSTPGETTKREIKINFQEVAPTLELTLDSNSTANGVRDGQSVTVTAAYSNGINTDSATYTWHADKSVSSSSTSNNGKSYTFVPSTTGTYTITCKVKDGQFEDAKVANKEITVNEDKYVVAKSGTVSSTMAQGENQTLKVKVTKKSDDSDVLASQYTVKWTSSDTKIAKFDSETAKDGKLVAQNKSGSTTVTAKVTYLGKEYEVSFGTIKVKAADATIKEITNDGRDYLSVNSLKDIVAEAISSSSDATVRRGDIDKITVSSYPSHVDLYEDEVKSTKKITGSSKDLTTVNDLYFAADAGYIGKSELVLSVKLDEPGSGLITVTLYIPVVGDDKIDATVNGSSARNDVSFKVSDAVDYSYLYVYGSKSSPSTSKPSDYDGYWTKTATTASGWAKCSSSDTITVPNSKFSNGKATLYVVGLDSSGVASTGTITVSQKSYDINYNVVAGKSVSFSQKDFDSFLEDIADDAGVYNSRKDTLELSYVKFSLPNSTREGVLYEGKSKIDRNDKVEDLDKVTFESVAKAKDTITISFTAYGKLYKDGASKGKDVDYSGNVVISVVKEDIVYTVGIDDTVQLTARDFVNFLQDAKTSYRKAELDYVKFDVSGKNVSSYAYGGLYRSYSSYSTGKLADSTDKFYYEPSRTQYDLADVAYHTTRWAEAGKTVYIPFTVYGTKSGEEASGTMAITIAQTMNFIDVKASDFFYEPVKWAVNNKITNGTSSTTFSPYKNCNRAEIVTFLWRAAGSPEPTSTRNPFTDVNSVRDASYYKAILWASQKGITAGTNATTFSPYQECTRSQIVTFLYRYAGKPSGYYSNPFKDVSSVNEASYYNAILWAVGKGITQGTSTTTFSPYASCTRGEAVTFLYRYVNGVK